jgi:chromate transport protein ChrA
MKSLKAAITIIVTLILVSTAQAQLDERIATTAYIYNFLRLTDWPTPPKQPFHLCILGHTTLDGELHLLEGKQLRKDVTI